MPPSGPLVEGLLARCEFAVGQPATLAVSGGPDSLAMLALACASGLDVVAIHVDHGLRPGSASEAGVVRDAAAQFGATFETRSAPIEIGPNLEARAREARFAALPADVATAHTADDLAETMLLNLMRGSGPDGMAAMRASWRHPVLRLRRREMHALCAELSLRPVQDPMNDDPAFRRNRVRHDLIPMLDEIAGRDVVPVLARQAEVFAADADLLTEMSNTLDRTDAKALRSAPRPLAARALRRWVRELTGHPPNQATLARMFEVVDGDVRATEIAGGYRLARTDSVLRIEAFDASLGDR